MSSQHSMRQPVKLLTASLWSGQTLSVSSIVRGLRWMLIAPCLVLCTGCSQTLSGMLMPQLPANLAQTCPTLLPPPNPAIDPYRLEWEIGVLSNYEDCAKRHKATVNAWPKAKVKHDR